MKLSAILPIAFICTSRCAALPEAAEVQGWHIESQQHAPRASTSTCSIGVGRVFWRTIWDITVYNVAQADRQDVNIITTMKNAQMDKGQNVTVQSLTDGITIIITNVDNAPTFTYDIPDLVAPISDPANGHTKVLLHFDIPSLNVTFTTADCAAGNVIFSAGRESWSCDFPCSLPPLKEL